MRRVGNGVTSVLVAMSILIVGMIAIGTSPPAGATGSPITIAFIVDQTGLAASTAIGAADAFTARLDVQNANGGVNGHKLVPLIIDTQTNPSTATTGIQDAISRGVIGIVNDSGLFVDGAKYAQQAGIPVTGNSSDGPEWGQKPYTNMFASDFGSIDPAYPVYTLEGKILKMFGASNLATYGYGVSPYSARATDFDALSFKHYGGKIGVQDASVPFGSVDFTAEALVAKHRNVDALYPNLLASSNFALAAAFKQAGIKLKTAVFPIGYDPTVVGTPAWSDVQGDIFQVEFHPFAFPNAGTRQMQAAMQKYGGWTRLQFPTFAQSEAWVGADLMIKGIQSAGANPSPGGVIKALRGINTYNANGLLPITINFTNNFGKAGPMCTWQARALKNGFSFVSSQPVCGTAIPGTSTANFGG